MLYVTTRSKNDAFTAARTMNHDRGPDGGLFVPFRLPVFDQNEVFSFAQKSFGQSVADILNLFYGSKLTGWDVDMAISRTPYQLNAMNYRIITAELWHNIDQNFDRTVNALARLVHPDGELIGDPGSWTQIAVRVAVLFGIFGELLRTEQVRFEKPMDIAVYSGSFCDPMAAWYARKMGLPIGTIICGCNENSAPWDLLHRGELDTAMGEVSTLSPDADIALPQDLERLICESCGQEEALNYFWSCTEGGTYAPEKDAFDAMRQGMFAAVISRVREETIIPSVYRTNQYILDPYAALAYGALSDYRSRSGKSNMTLLICAKSPICNAETVAKSMQISVSELRKRLSDR